MREILKQPPTIGTAARIRLSFITLIIRYPENVDNILNTDTNIAAREGVSQFI